MHKKDPFQHEMLYKLSFAKYHGNGNDFIIINGSDQDKDSLISCLKKAASSLCSRHRGIGADGILVIFEHNNKLELIVINSDGSQAKNCGNGLRCAAQWYFNQHSELENINILLCDINYLCEKINNKILVDMGSCIVKQEEENLFIINISNNHVVLILDHEPEDKNIYLNKLALKFDNNNYNLGLLWPKNNNSYYSVVRESGAGLTQSCASGASAAAAAVCLTRQAFSLTKLEIYQSGGMIELSLEALTHQEGEASFRIWQKGPAQEIFSGIWQQK